MSRLFVMPGDSHVTEERKIRSRIATVRSDLMTTVGSMRSELNHEDWIAASTSAREIQRLSSEMWVLDQRLQDVIDINEQFARIDAQIERIESQEKGNASTE